MVLEGVCAVARRPSVFNFHGANFCRTKGREKRDNCIAKSNCRKRSRNGKQFNSSDEFDVFNPTSVGLICRICTEFGACMWIDCHRKFLHASCCSEFRVKHAQVKIMIAMLLQLLRCAVGPNALSHLSVARDTSSCPNHWWSTVSCHNQMR